MKLLLMMALLCINNGSSTTPHMNRSCASKKVISYNKIFPSLLIVDIY